MAIQIILKSRCFIAQPTWYTLSNLIQNLFLSTMELLILLGISATAILLVFFLRRSKQKDMYVKREHQIQAFPPGYKDRR